jgi:hypothetical protein
MYAYRRITYQNAENEKVARITSAAAEYAENDTANHVAGGLYTPANTVERIVIVGQRAKPIAVSLFSSAEKDAQAVAVEFEVNEQQGHAITLKKPNCLIGSNWRIEIQY